MGWVEQAGVWWTEMRQDGAGQAKNIVLHTSGQKDHIRSPEQVTSGS